MQLEKASLFLLRPTPPLSHPFGFLVVMVQRGMTALHRCTIEGHTPMITLLMKNGANKDLVNEVWTTDVLGFFAWHLLRLIYQV